MKEQDITGSAEGCPERLGSVISLVSTSHQSSLRATINFNDLIGRGYFDVQLFVGYGLRFRGVAISLLSFQTMFGLRKPHRLSAALPLFHIQSQISEDCWKSWLKRSADLSFDLGLEFCTQS